MTKINLDDTYEIAFVSNDLRIFSFTAILKDGSAVELNVHISRNQDPFLAEVFNLAFGPYDWNGEIDDKINLHHKYPGRVFSTILLCALTFLNEHPEISIGIDGSNDARAYLYHRMFSTNHGYLSEIISTAGIDWYVRLLRDGNVEMNDRGRPLFKPKPEPFDLSRPARELYRYYMFTLKTRRK